jgi:CheY-like chemotaxis protein
VSKALRIAIADDELDVRDYFQRMLPRLGYEVVAMAANGRELVNACCEQNPDLIITDIRMPEMDGDVAVQQICSVRPTPFILISACVESRQLAEVASVCQVHLTKPVKLHDLIEAIKRVSMLFDNND